MMNFRTASRFQLAASRFKNPDRVILLLLLLLAFLWVIDPSQATESIGFMIDSLLFITPFLLIAVALAASIKASGVDALVVHAFSGHPVRAVVVAAAFGALSPFCSCGVIPLITAMLAAGVPLAPVMAFWIASPVMDPELFILTSAGISVEFAIAKAVCAIALGIFAGFMVLFMSRTGSLEQVLRGELQGQQCSTACTTDGQVPIRWTFWRSKSRLHTFFLELKLSAFFLGKWLALAFFLESLMVSYIDPQWVQHYLSGSSPLVIPIAALIGMPSYLNGYAAIPLVGELMNLGMSQGAAMAFMLTGAVSSIPAAIAVYAIVQLRVFLLYLMIGFSGSVLCGFAYAMFVS